MWGAKMPLDPHVKGLLDFIAAAGRPKIWQLTPPEARQAFLALANLADAKNEPIGKIENGELPGPAIPLPFRLYTPIEAAAEPLAGLVYFHGGGFVIGNLDTHDGFLRMLANASGCRVISIDYRLAPEHKFPAAIEDAYAATKWVADHAATLGIDPNRLAVGGDSAGGNLAALVCQLAKKAGTPKIALQVLFCAATDVAGETESHHAFAEGYFLDQKSIRWFMQQYLPPGDVRASPLRADDLAGLPPAHIHTAEFDPLRDEGKAYADRLKRSGGNVQYTCHTGMIHHFYGMAHAIPYARVAVKDAGAAIKAALTG
ncbi:MAG TPA: alpha/beta hydrolase [Xanthobacteraceae bacterium]|nr:alpha/beta hydrolase [Xanthobacteraceae bacterium]